jgi:hypothetical protein
MDFDEWGEQVESIKDEGVFDESALGSNEQAQRTPQFPATVQAAFPYAPTPRKTVKRVAANRYALYEEAPVKRATAGMGTVETGGFAYQEGDVADWMEDVLGPSTGATGITTPSSAVSSAQRQEQIIGGITDVFGAIGSAVQTGFQTAAAWQTHEAQMEQASAQLDMQMRLFEERLLQMREGSSEAEALAALLAQAEAAQASGSSEQMLAALAAMQSARTPTWVWVVGGVAVLGLAGGLIYAITKKG